MADSILRLKVESQEYDAKLKRAAQGLQQYADGCRKVGGTLEVVEKDTLEFVRAIGQMESTAKGAKSSLAEMTKTFTDLSVQYNKLTDAEKAAPFGQALKGSLDELKGRIQAGNAEIKNINDSINGGGGLTGALDGLAGKFGLNITQLTKFGSVAGVATTALQVAKDAFFASEANVDEWGRTVKSAQGVYEGFLYSINNGDISGFLGRIDQIVQAARQAYDELDKLGTMKTIQGPQISAQQTENERMRMMIQTGRYIAPVDGRRASMQNGQLLTPEQIKRLEQQLQGGMTKMVGLVGNEVKQTGKAIDAYYNSLAKQNGMTMEEFRKGTSSWAEYSKKMAGYDAYKEWDKNARIEFAKQGGRGNVDFDKSNPYAEYRKWGTFRVDKTGDNSLNDLVNLIKQRDQQASQAYSTMSQSYRTMNRAEGITLNKIMGRDGSGGGKSTKEEKDDFVEIIGLIPNAEEAVKSLQQQIRDSWDEGEIASLTKDLQAAEKELERLRNIGKEVKPQEMVQGLSGFNAQTMGAWMQGRQGDLPKAEYGSADYENIMANIADMNTIKTVLEESMKAGIDAAQFDLEPLWEKVFDGENIDDSVWQSMVDTINEKLKEMELDPIKIDFKTGSVKNEAKKMTDDWKDAASAIQSVGSAMMAIEDPAAKVMGTIAQAVASIALGAGQAIAQAGNGSAGGPWGWIAFAAAATATMISTIASIHSATGYANGGIVDGRGGGFVGGTAYSGDQVGNVRLDSGELVLNRAQQGNLASQLQEQGGGGQHIVGVLKGEDIVLMADRWGMRTGRGELLFAKNL